MDWLSPYDFKAIHSCFLEIETFLLFKAYSLKKEVIALYEHKFIKIELDYKQKPKEDYYSIVSEHEKEGWELVQIFALQQKAMDWLPFSN